MRVILKLN